MEKVSKIYFTKEFLDINVSYTVVAKHDVQNGYLHNISFYMRSRPMLYWEEEFPKLD